MKGMQVGLLGPVQLTIDGAEIPIRRPQLRRMLVVLGLNPGRVVSTDLLVDAMWEEALPLDPQHALHVYINRLRKLGPGVAAAVRTEPRGYVMDVPRDAVDVQRFESGVAAGHGLLDVDALAARERLVGALALWRGTPFGMFQYAESFADAARRLEEQRLDALEDLCDADIRLGEARRALPALYELVSQNPFREHLVALLMRALDADGRRIEALAAYRAHSVMLERELGAEPSMAIQTIAYEVLLGGTGNDAAGRGAGSMDSLYPAAR